jgi:hypothetical protein
MPVNPVCVKNPLSKEGALQNVVRNVGKGLSTQYWDDAIEDKELMEYLLRKIINPILVSGARQETNAEFLTGVMRRWGRYSSMSQEEMEKGLVEVAGSVDEGAKMLHAAEMLLQSTHVNLMQARKHPDLYSKNKALRDASRRELLQWTDKFVKQANPIYMVSRAFGKALQSRQVTKYLTTASGKKLEDVADKFLHGPKADKDFNAYLISLKNHEGDITAIAKDASDFMRYSGSEKYMAALTEAWRGSLLLNFSTNVTNILSGLSETVIIPFERWLGTSAPFQYRYREGALHFDPAIRDAHNEAWAHFRYLGEGFNNGLRAAWYVLKNENQILDPFHGGMIEMPTKSGVQDVNTAYQWTAQNWNLDPGSIPGTAVDYLGKYFRMSFRLLGSADELVKQTNYWATLKAKYHREAIDMMGKGVSRNKIESTVANRMKHHFQEDGYTPKLDDSGKMLTDLDALTVAQDATHTKPAWDDSIVKKTTELVNANPVLGMFLPFIRTPADLINKAYQRTPALGVFSKRLRQDFNSPDPLKRAQAISRQTMGSAVVFAGYQAYMDGKITGRGPSDPSTKKIWLQTNQENSILIDGKWVSYNKMDPTGMLLGMVANGMDASRNEALLGHDASDIVAATTLAITATIGDKSSLRGVMNMATLFSDQIIGKDYAVKNLVNQHVSSWVPTLFQQMYDWDTKYIKEATGLIEQLQRKTPYGNNVKLPLRYNFITGKPEEIPQGKFWGIPQKNEVTDKVMQTLVQLNTGIAGPTHAFSGIELTSQQYSDWSRLMGTTTMSLYGGKTLHKALKQVIESPEFDHDPNRVYVRAQGEDESPQAKMVKRVFRHYKAEAKRLLIEEHPNLQPSDPAGLDYPQFLQ